MVKAILFNFNGVIINDEALHEKLIGQLLLEENLRPKPGEFRQLCLGRSDRACLQDVFYDRGRVLSEVQLDGLIDRKAAAYKRELTQLGALPIYPGLTDFLFQVQSRKLKTAIVSGALRADIDLVLDRAQLQGQFSLIVSGDENLFSKPHPGSYLTAIARLNQQFPSLNAQPEECLAIEDTFLGIEAAKRAKIPVVGVANTYPFHMLHRRANWAVDYLSDLELDRIQPIIP